MDMRLKTISENYEQMLIGLDDTFRFHCTTCGKCCINREDILLNALDVYNLAKELNMSTTDVFQEYCEAYVGKYSHMIIVRLKPLGSAKRCPLLKGQKCSVHKAKPTVCALYPLGRTMVSKTDQTLDFSKRTPQYILQEITCGDKSETHTVREWLNEFNISEHDLFFPLWMQTISDIGSFVREAEKHVGEKAISLVFNAILISIYLKYDTNKPFLPQFQENSTMLFSIMSQAGVIPKPFNTHN